MKNSNGSDSENSVHSVEKSLPNSKKVYVAGKIYPDIRVRFGEIPLGPTKWLNGEIEVNEPVRVYDTNGPWGDNSASPARTVTLDPVQGLPPLRREWILKRGDVEEIEGRKVQPIDDGFLSEKHAVSRNGDGNASFNRANRKTLRAKSHPVTQLYYATKALITPQMQFIPLPENGPPPPEY